MNRVSKQGWLALVLAAIPTFASGGAGAQPAHLRERYQLEYSTFFESNEGQADPEVRFISHHGASHLLLLSGTEAIFASTSSGGDKNPCARDSVGGKAARTPRLPQRASCRRPPNQDFARLHLLGTNPQASPTGRKPLPSYSNYLVGNDPKRWHTHVPQFAEVWYPAIYPGVDLVYYGNEGQLEYDFIVAPGANPNRIEFSIAKTATRSPVRVNQKGDLEIPSGQGKILLRKPLLYQGKSCTEHRPAEGTSGCAVLNGGEFRIRRTGRSGVRVDFDIPMYDHNQPLIIDPSVSFSTFLGGNMGQAAYGMALDSAGNICLLGDTNSPDFPITANAYQKTVAGSSDLFITKLSSDGSQIIYSTFLGGSGDDEPRAIAVDSANNVYVTGETFSKDFPLVHPYQTQETSGSGFASKLSADGSTLIYSTYLTGTLNTSANAIAVDSSGEAVVAGLTVATDFPVVNAFQPTHAADNGTYDAFLTKFSADGTSLIFSTYLGGDSGDEIKGVALDSSGNIYVTGITSSTNFPTTPGSYQSSYIQDPEGSSFVSKFIPSGTSLIYSTYLIDCATFGIALNRAGNAFVTGQAGWFAFPVTPGAFQTTQGGGSSLDAFVTEFDATGSSLVYSTFLGGKNEDYGFAIAVDSLGDAYVAGQTYSSNFPVHNPIQSQYTGVYDVFVSELNSTGSALIFSTYLGGTQPTGQTANTIQVASPGTIVVAGGTLSADFPVVNAIQPQMSGSGDAFITKYEVPPDFVLSGSPLSQTVSAGETAKYSLTLSPTNGLNQSISVLCLGAPAQSTCSVSPPTVTLDGVHDGTATVTVTTTVRSANLMDDGMRVSPLNSPRVKPTIGILFSLALAAPFFVGTDGRRRDGRKAWLGVVAFVLVLAFMPSCGGGGASGGGQGGGGTPTGNYTITTTAKVGNVNHSTDFTLVVK